ncbi:hypothetical protein BACI71_100291 [Bacillus mycoides]|uniref:Uncharacterized protein n=1 Tax=Bacillus mycoides TaxID=1405 RepID=A0A653NF72_BACMY|nr:hypothetical protein BACI71_100291 [Bacillus mycoides]
MALLVFSVLGVEFLSPIPQPNNNRTGTVNAMSFVAFIMYSPFRKYCN